MLWEAPIIGGEAEVGEFVVGVAHGQAPTRGGVVEEDVDTGHKAL